MQMSLIVRAVPPRWRLPMLVLGFLSLATGIAGGLSRLVAHLPAPEMSLALHGALMVSGFFGTVISLERASALDRLWAYGAPLACGLGGIALLAGSMTLGFWLFVLGAACLVASCIAVILRQSSLETWILMLGAACWLIGNVIVAAGAPLAAALGWWIAFFTLTIGAERLELSRYVRRPPTAQAGFIVIAAILAVAGAQWSLGLGAGLLGIGLVALAAWLFAYDIARNTIRQQRLTRYIAACLLPGYAWLGLGGVLLLLPSENPLLQDAWLHAILVGFVFSMVFGHAPVIFPAVARIAIPYSAWLYLPLALLHASLAARVAGDLAGIAAWRTLGAFGNALAVALFIVVAASRALSAGRSPGRAARQ